jgi:hypothetical protein
MQREMESWFLPRYVRNGEINWRHYRIVCLKIISSGLACSVPVAEESDTDTYSSDSVKNFKKKLSIWSCASQLKICQ